MATFDVMKRKTVPEKSGAGQFDGILTKETFLFLSI